MKKEGYLENKIKYEDVYKSLDEKFKKMGGDEFLFYETTVWFRHDNVSGYVKDLMFGNRIKKTPPFHQYFSLMKRIISVSLLRLRNFFHRFPPARNVEFVFLYNTFAGDRLGEFYKKLSANHSVVEYHLKDSSSLSRHLGGKSVYLFLSFSIIFSELVKSVLIHYRAEKHSGLSEYVTIAKLFDALVYRECFRRAVKMHDPKAVISSVSLNNPYARNIFSTCEEIGVTSVNLIQKPFSDRSIPFLSGISRNSKGLPNNIIVLNSYCKKILDEHLHSNKKICVGYKDKLEDAPCVHGFPGYVGIERIVVILGVDEDVNFSMIGEIASLECGEKNYHVIVKPHPLLDVDKQKKVYDIVSQEGYSVSKLSWHDLIIPYRTLSISASSTAQCEAAAFGAYVVWLPYLDPHAFIHHFIIDALGYVCLDGNEFGCFMSEKVESHDFMSEQWRQQSATLIRYLPEGDAYEQFTSLISAT